jgi:hypothetical protein
MQPEGMVHALENIHHMLTPGGFLVDIHPFPEGHFIEAYQDGRLLFSERVRENDSEYVLHAEQALADVIDREIYSIENSAAFYFKTYSSSVDELSNHWDSLSAFDDPRDEAIVAREKQLFAQANAILQTSGENAKAAITERAKITLLKPLSGSMGS